MKHDWEYKKLGEVGSFQRGKGIQKTHFVANGMPCIHYGQIHTTFGVSTLNHISEIPHDLYEQSIIASKGDVLLALTSEDVEGSCKSTAWLGDYDVAISSDAAVFKHNLNPKFVVYYTQTKAFFIEKSKYARGFKVTHIKTSDIETIPIPVPSIEIQSLIVSELDSLSKIIADCKETLKDYDALEQSIFYDMFGDPVKNEKGLVIKRLDEIFSLITDGTHQTPTYTEDKENGVKFLSAKDVTSGDICWDNIKYIPFDLHKELHARLAPQRNDILLCKNGTTGICAIVDTDEVFDIYVSLALLRPNDGCVPLYLKYAINNPWTKQQFDESLKGVGVPNLHLGEIKKVKILLPPLPLQQQFASKIEAIEQMKSETKKALQEAETLFNARMDYWFN